MTVIQGVGISDGISVGKLFCCEEPEEPPERICTADPDEQCARFQKAQKEAGELLETLCDRAQKEAGREEAMIFEAYRMLLADRVYTEAVQERIRRECVSAEYAVQQAGETFASMFRAMDDAYMRERAADIRDVSRQVISVLRGGLPEAGALTEPCIVTAEDPAPGRLLQMDREKLLGLVTEKGSANSHTAILARAMGIPAIVRAEGILSGAWDGHPAVLDGREGLLYVDPDEETLRRLVKKREEIREERRLLQTLKGKENVTRSGRRMEVFANIGEPGDVEKALENDAGGIGLFRSEFLYLGRDTFPTEEEQFRACRQVLERMAGRKVVIRTLDIGADKKADYFNLEEEENPALGYRAIRICLTRTDIFRTQLRALYRAAAYGDLSILFPLIISVEEVRRIREIAGQVREELRKEGAVFREDVELGIMIETPAAALISAELAEEADFFSVGTNDLIQYTLAIDRRNANLARFCDPHHPAVLELIRMTAQNAHRAGKRIGICGELAADLSLTGTFIQMGIDELSVSPQAILPLRKKIRECE